MGLDELRARLDSLLASHTRPEDSRSRAEALHGALVDLKVAMGESREALTAAERELASERGQLEAAERRGGLAANIGDAETARIAGEFATKHRERAGLLERKIALIKDEFAFAEREYQAVSTQYQDLRRGVGGPAPVPRGDPLDGEFDALKAQADREAAAQAVQAQLEQLKQKLNKR
jgi:hypothetical protein